MTGTTDSRVTTMPTTRSLQAPAIRPVAHLASAGPEHERAADVQVQLPALIWLTAISPGRSGRGSRPASSFGISSWCPNLPSAGTTTGPLVTGPPSAAAVSRSRRTIGATAATSGSRARAR